MTINKRLEVDAGHRLLLHEGKCRHIHGHRYAFEVEVGADTLDQVGRVVDFSVVKELVGGWLDRNFDHAFIAQLGDPIIPFLEQHGQRHTVVPFPPTAENLADHVLQVARVLLDPRGLVVRSVTCYETPTSRAVAR